MLRWGAGGLLLLWKREGGSVSSGESSARPQHLLGERRGETAAEVGWPAASAKTGWAGDGGHGFIRGRAAAAAIVQEAADARKRRRSAMAAASVGKAREVGGAGRRPPVWKDVARRLPPRPGRAAGRRPTPSVRARILVGGGRGAAGPSPALVMTTAVSTSASAGASTGSLLRVVGRPNGLLLSRLPR